MTCDETLGAEASEFFNAITGYSQPPAFTKLAAAPLGLKETLLGLIEAEAERRRQGDKKARIIAKMNSLVDRDVIEALYRASHAGVRILLNVRGVCCLRPGVRGLSENISVVSIVDRFLEHSRIFYFRHGGENRLYISSADWMPRNLERRIELMVPVEDAACHKRLFGILETMFKDNVKAHKLTADGTYVPVSKSARRKPFRVQTHFMEEARRNFESMVKNRPTVFIPHRPAEDR
jgi:polyphosphate kinase